MSNLLLVLSKDPYTTEIPNLVLDIGLNAKAKNGSKVSLYLVEDGVTAARKSEFGNKLLDAKKKGIRILADDKAVQSRGLNDSLIPGVEVKEIGTLLDHIVEDNTRVAWF
ncbi:MAG: DsrH/TusB family sulfur metabolism protein [Candidatus Methanoperedens sp.]|nr:DsrH/TusB family sulfur metabolism protein [Candidatus Methanoperedens sp.]